MSNKLWSTRCVDKKICLTSHIYSADPNRITRRWAKAQFVPLRAGFKRKLYPTNVFVTVGIGSALMGMTLVWEALLSVENCFHIVTYLRISVWHGHGYKCFCLYSICLISTHLFFPGLKYSIRAVSGTSVDRIVSKKKNGEESSQNWKIKMLYDGECPLCMREVFLFDEFD